MMDNRLIIKIAQIALSDLGNGYHFEDRRSGPHRLEQE